MNDSIELKHAINEVCYYTKKLYELKNDMQLGVIPDEEYIETIVSNLDDAESRRLSLLTDSDNKSNSFTDNIIFKDNGELIDGVVVGPVNGALDFVAEQSASDDLYMREMAAFVAISL
ncbi:MAG: hypothetical protein K6G88_11180 [Lachnospiraceae bacterium]|nr:hypothetical protein [Lachnospiraceae bacterium]